MCCKGRNLWTKSWHFLNIFPYGSTRICDWFKGPSATRLGSGHTTSGITVAKCPGAVQRERQTRWRIPAYCHWRPRILRLYVVASGVQVCNHGRLFVSGNVNNHPEPHHRWLASGRPGMRHPAAMLSPVSLAWSECHYSNKRPPRARPGRASLQWFEIASRRIIQVDAQKFQPLRRLRVMKRSSGSFVVELEAAAAAFKLWRSNLNCGIRAWVIEFKLLRHPAQDSRPWPSSSYLLPSTFALLAQPADATCRLSHARCNAKDRNPAGGGKQKTDF